MCTACFQADAAHEMTCIMSFNIFNATKSFTDNVIFGLFLVTVGGLKFYICLRSLIAN